MSDSELEMVMDLFERTEDGSNVSPLVAIEMSLTSPKYQGSAVALSCRGMELIFTPAEETPQFLAERGALVDVIKQAQPSLLSLEPTQAQDAWKNYFLRVFFETTGTDRRSLREYDSANDFSTALFAALRGSLDICFLSRMAKTSS
jgi:hypothetical protein